MRKAAALLTRFREELGPHPADRRAIEGRNLLDKRYISTTIAVETATAASALFNPGMGRAVFGGLRYRM